jgi:deoxyribose-phosphate aldolase
MMNIARMIDHILLKADATKDQIEKLQVELEV